jgi:hypothetical protein
MHEALEWSELSLIMEGEGEGLVWPQQQGLI